MRDGLSWERLTSRDFPDVLSRRVSRSHVPSTVRGLRFRLSAGKIACFPSSHCSQAMARVCQVTGKKPMVGNHVSHANNKTKRRFMPNLQRRRFWVESENRWVSLRLTNSALRLIDKNGIDSVLADLRARGEHV